MYYTNHHSKLAVEEVSFSVWLRVVLLQLLSIHDRAVGVTNLGVMLLWSQLPWGSWLFPCGCVMTPALCQPSKCHKISWDHISLFEWHGPFHWRNCEKLEKKKTESVIYFITVPADCLALLGARASVLVTMFRYIHWTDTGRVNTTIKPLL